MKIKYPLTPGEARVLLTARMHAARTLVLALKKSKAGKLDDAEDLLKDFFMDNGDLKAILRFVKSQTKSKK